MLDKGEMIAQDEGDVLEKGTSMDPETGEEYSYEELRTDLPLEIVDSGKGARECVVLPGTKTGDTSRWDDY